MTFDFPGWKLLRGPLSPKSQFSDTGAMFHTPILPRTRKRSREEVKEEEITSHREQVKFRDVRLYLVERKMGHSRRSFLSQLARSKGFLVEDVLRLGQVFLLLLYFQQKKNANTLNLGREKKESENHEGNVKVLIWVSTVTPPRALEWPLPCLVLQT